MAQARQPGAFRLVWAALLPVALLVLASASAPARAQQGRIEGRILGAGSGVALAEAKVVLVQFKLDAKGVPQGTPIQIRNADKQGAYAFSNIPIDRRAVYKLGTRIAGQVISSDSFTFPAGQSVVQLNLRVPSIVTSAEGLHIRQALLALEPYVGGLWVTEVVHMDNPTGNVIDASSQPLELSVPPDADSLDLLKQGKGDEPALNHSQLGPKLLIYGTLQPGVTSIAFRYRVAVRLGTLEMNKHYPQPVDQLTVLAPKGSLRIASDQLDARQPQEFEGVVYDTWAGTKVPAKGAIILRASGVPMRQEMLLLPAAGFFVLMGGVVAWYRLRRIRASP